jgi:glycosidase
MLATALQMMKCTPYIYQGEEIGMTNVKFDTIDQYQDIETLNFYREKIAEGFTHEEMMHAIWENSRDNARTPMHWDESENAGFTKGKPWLEVNPNYDSINVKEALEDKNSVFYHYQKLIKLRKAMPVITYGSFTLLLEEHPQIFAYVRTYGDERILVVTNFSKDKVRFELDKAVEVESFNVLLSNYHKAYDTVREIELEAYEAVVIAI